MGFTQKSGPANALAIVGQIPQPPPRVPHEMVRRFPDWEDYDKGMQEWWGRFSDMWQRDRGMVQAQFQADELLAKTNTTNIQASLTQISSELAILASNPALSVSLAALIAQVAALTGDLAAHIGSVVVHGTSSPVVGETDEQNLEHKNIGQINPGYGRFIGGGLAFREIPFGTVLTITETDSLITAGPLDVSGGLVVAGTLLSL